jgi:hypothetical protein
VAARSGSRLQGNRWEWTRLGGTGSCAGVLLSMRQGDRRLSPKADGSGLAERWRAFDWGEGGRGPPETMPRWIQDLGSRLDAEMPCPGAEHRQRIAHGVSRGLKRERIPAPEGRKIPGGSGSVAPLGLGPTNNINPRLTPWATFFRPSGPGGTAWVADLPFGLAGDLELCGCLRGGQADHSTVRTNGVRARCQSSG